MTRHSPILAALAVAAIALAGCHKTPATNTAYNNSGSSATTGSSMPSSTTSTTSTSDTSTNGSTASTTPDTSSASTTSPTSATADTSSPASTTSSTATTGSSGSNGNVVTDTVQTGKIKAAFASENGLKDSDISVDTKDGVVTLTGTAKSKEQIALATSVAQRQEGVNRVDSQVVVK